MGAVAVIDVAEVAAQREALTALVRGFEPGALSAAECVHVRQHATAMKNMAAVLESLAAARVAETQLATESGAASAADDLATATGVPKARAADALDTARRLRDQPVLDEAVRAGELSLEQATLVSAAAAANPIRERDLVDTAKTASLGRLKAEAERAKKAADPDPAAAEARVHRNRRYRMWTDDDVFKLFGVTTKRHGLTIRAAIEAKTDELFHQARREGRREPREAYAMDALHAICEAYLDGRLHEGEAGEDDADARPRARIRNRIIGILRVDYRALTAGDVAEGEICEIDGLGPIDVATARDLLGDALLHLVITDGTPVRAVVNLSRRPTVAQQIALAWESAGRCFLTDCDCPKIEIHHHDPWAKTQLTLLDQLRTPCGHHHVLISQGWRVVEHPDGRCTLEPPDATRA